ncbi:Psp-related protein [Histomonas meleagridis]|uniref:Psp-related protein n=1 Tax=Histomonas meleagridis TaxID=135588 RepID=UPI00355A3212|nr:Psp-related protein [Histomonas meleagridis]KAH0804198.1 Psp-related protein [Histomonas meleagridis]
MSRVPFAKRTPSQSQHKEFYWRGGDGLHEKEYLIDEYKKALTEYRRAENEYQQVEREYQEASETLKEREGYGNALANYLDADAEGSQTEQDCKKRLSELEVEIRDAETELQKAKSVHHPSVALGLQKEKAYLMIEIQRNKKTIDLAHEQAQTQKQQLASCVVSNKYQTATDLETKYQELSSKKSFLRSKVNKTKKEFDNTKPCTIPQSQEVRHERSALLSQTETETALQEAKEKKQRKEKKMNGRINRLLDEIEELNDRLRDLELEDETVDVEELRDKYMKKDDNDDGKGKEKEKENKNSESDDAKDKE